MTLNPIPNFLLYGEDESEPAPDFAHIETIAARSALYDWEISPHRHLHSVQALLVSQGQVEFRCDDLVRTLEAPCFMVVPIGSVHGFRFSPETLGHVLSLSPGFITRAGDATDPMLHMLTRGASGTVPRADEKRVEWLCRELLAIQSDWRTPQPLFLALAEALIRSLPGEKEEDGVLPAEDARLSGFRQLVELHLREHRSLGWYAERLGVTDKTLTRICRKRLDCTPVELIHARLILEAQRLLFFSNASIVEVADDLGFSDPSYFSRFYRRMTGRRPLADKSGSRAGGDERSPG
ncbi:helix-turn-helix domain-containing protein [Novosphingobium pentaromativorans]|nr:helix-turn-helix domain-containing protein [Novosphingobium pentaromativorans]AIT81998.1 AraC family transcriptional regulator [Novosphingobium pentaromativorans US6-1]